MTKTPFGVPEGTYTTETTGGIIIPSLAEEIKYNKKE